MGMEIICEKYKIVECLHQSESNVVYRVEHLVLGNHRIIKKMRKQENFQLSEVEILKTLSHPNIPKIIDVIEEEDFIYLIREEAKGETLQIWREKRKKLVEEDLWKILTQLADVLYYLHCDTEVPVIYRDLKPENIIVDERLGISLIDFGIARFAKPERTRDTMFLGTKAYAAPEQFGIFKCDERTDIYAFGMTMYYLLGKHVISEYPYKRVDAEQWHHDYSEELVRLIYDCSEPQREKRPESFGEIRQRILKREKREENAFGIPEQAEIYMGIRRGAGTSYILYHRALQRANRGEKVAILDWSESQQIAKLCYVCEEVETKKSYFTVHGIDIYPQSKNGFPENAQEYEKILIDYGVFDAEKKRMLRQYVEKIRLVCSGGLWDMFDLDDAIFNEKLMDYRFILNLISEEGKEKLARDYPEIAWEYFSQDSGQEEAPETARQEKSSVLRRWMQSKIASKDRG